MTEVVWLDHLLCAEEYDKQIIASKERVAKKADKAASSTSRADDMIHTKRHKKNLKPKSAKEKTVQGKARYCSMCKKAGMPEGKWKSHHTNGTLGDWKKKTVELGLQEGEKPHSSRYYPMPRVHKPTFKKELLRLVEIGVLEEVCLSEWGSPTFIIPKKQGTVRFISNFRKLEAKIKRKPYPIPRISNVLQQLEGFQHATTLDLNMGYHTVSIGLGSRDLTTIVTEFGK